ncbi:hypothetical protein XELAEV_18041904mg [Xenopus laevis]|uniref:Uncharacterized protein n=1 Tax=Xenopus laevis TaxID=8355 RepID=A0A974C305_XENLA|nr:hypothetical protein XELAEV_18041904mg [Xenopus laevis]
MLALLTRELVAPPTITKLKTGDTSFTTDAVEIQHTMVGFYTDLYRSGLDPGGGGGGSRFNQFHPTINLTLYHSYSHINFLDSTIYIKKELYKHPYTKNQQVVLHILCGTVFILITTTTELFTTKNKHLHSLRKTFVNQGYHPQVIDDQILRPTQIPRDTFLD